MEDYNIVLKTAKAKDSFYEHDHIHDALNNVSTGERDIVTIDQIAEMMSHIKPSIKKGDEVMCVGNTGNGSIVWRDIEGCDIPNATDADFDDISECNHSVGDFRQKRGKTMRDEMSDSDFESLIAWEKSA